MAPGPSRLYHGWILVAVATFCYGLGIGPAYNSWGFFGPELTKELGISATELGSIFGLFSAIYKLEAPLVGYALNRWGLRATISLGSLLAAIGFFGVSRSDSVFDFHLYFSVIGGVGIGLSTILPAQALATVWFRKYRARAMAIIFTVGGLAAVPVNPFNAFMLDHGGWRDCWLIISLISLSVAIVAAVFIRNTPEQMGLHPDGIAPQKQKEMAARRDTPAAPGDDEFEWTAAQSIRTPQFAMITLCAIAYAAPWITITTHGRQHLDSLGYSAGFVATIFSARLAVNNIGRLASMAGDFVSPQRILALGLFVETIGMAGLTVASGQTMVLLSMIVLGVGFGAAYISIPLVFAHFFGRQAFAVTQGTSRMVMSVFSYLIPTLAGAGFDRTGSFTASFVGIMVITLVGAVSAVLCPSPSRVPAARGAQAVD